MVKVSREVIENLKKYQELVLKWNDTINLVSKSSIQNFWTRHILDSLQLIQFIDHHNVSHLVDIGSGAGFPGIVLSIAGIKEVSLIESDTRKCIFLEKAAKISRNKIQIINKKIEEIEINCDILTCRALAPLDTIFNYSRNILVREKFLLLKGKNFSTELDYAKKQWIFNYDLHDSITSEGSKILEISNLVKII